MKKIVILTFALLLSSCSDENINKAKNMMQDTNTSSESKLSCTNKSTLQTVTELISSGVVKQSDNKKFELSEKIDFVSTVSKEPQIRCEASISYSFPDDVRVDKVEKILANFEILKNEINKDEIFIKLVPVDVSGILSMQNSVIPLRQDAMCKDFKLNLSKFNLVFNIDDSLQPYLNTMRKMEFSEFKKTEFNNNLVGEGPWTDINGNPPFRFRKDFYQKNDIAVTINSSYSAGDVFRGDKKLPTGYNISSIKLVNKTPAIEIFTFGNFANDQCSFK